MFSHLGSEHPHQRLCVEVEAIPFHPLDIAVPLSTTSLEVWPNASSLLREFPRTIIGSMVDRFVHRAKANIHSI